MPAIHREAGRDARVEFERRFQEESPRRSAVLVVVRRLASGRSKLEGAQRLTADHLGGEHVAIETRTAFTMDALEHHDEPIAELDLGVEVHFAREDLGE